MVTPPPDVPSTSTRSMARDLQENPNRQPGEPRVSEPYHNSIVERIRHIFRTAVSSNRCRTEYQNIDLDCACKALLLSSKHFNFQNFQISQTES